MFINHIEADLKDQISVVIVVVVGGDFLQFSNLVEIINFLLLHENCFYTTSIFSTLFLIGIVLIVEQLLSELEIVFYILNILSQFSLDYLQIV